MAVKVLYEDNHLIAVFKSAGMLTQADKSGDVCLMDEVKKYLKEKYKKPGNVFLGLLHRLDRPVSGIVLFAKTSKGASRLSEQFRNHFVEKIYHAIVLGKPEKEKGELVDLIRKITPSSLRGAVATKQSRRHVIPGLTRNPEFDARTPDSRFRGNDSGRGGKFKEAKLFYEVVKSNSKYSLLKIKLETGKFHQIRAQLSATGFPIVGDVKYGYTRASVHGCEWEDMKAIALCATNLSFTTATDEKRINLGIPLPAEWEKLFTAST